MKAILAIEKNGGIGYKGSMPWPKQSKDLQRFKDLTQGTVVIMGRGTWESTGMPKPLPNRTNVVITSNESYEPEGAYVLPSLDSIKYMPFAALPSWIIGGAGLVESSWDMIDEIHLSHLHAEYECDKHLDLDMLESDFELTRSQLCMTHTYEIWKRK